MLEKINLLDAIASTTRELQASFKAAINQVRKLRGQAPLPYSMS